MDVYYFQNVSRRTSLMVLYLLELHVLFFFLLVDFSYKYAYRRTIFLIPVYDDVG